MNYVSTLLEVSSAKRRVASYLNQRHWGGQTVFRQRLSLMNQVVQPGQIQNKIAIRFENGFARTGLFVIGEELRRPDKARPLRV